MFTNKETHLVGPFQLPITAAGDTPDHLHEHICALDHARNHGPQPERVGS